MKSLLKITENIVEKNLSRLGSIQNHIFFNWAHIAGQYADITIPHKIKFGRKKNIDGQITIKVQNGFGLEVQYAIPFLLDEKYVFKQKKFLTSYWCFFLIFKKKFFKSKLIKRVNAKTIFGF